MYLDVKVGKHGEVVIPAAVRKKLKIHQGERIKLNVLDDRVELISAEEDPITKLREYAKRYGLPKKKILYGDKLYEEVFG